MEMADVEEAVDRRHENVQSLRDWYAKATKIMSTMFGIDILYEKSGLNATYTMPDSKSKIQVNIAMNVSGNVDSAKV